MNDLDEKTVARFWAKVNKEGPVHPTLGTKCWLWTSALHSAGYGVFWAGRLVVYAHRVAYEASVGPIEPGFQIDHLCRVRGCVNPDHLEPVTQRENLLRGETLAAACAAKTHCPKGHPYSGENLRLYRGHRYCRECGRRSSGERRSHKRLPPRLAT